MTDIFRSPLTIQQFAEAWRRLPDGRFPEVAEPAHTRHAAQDFPVTYRYFEPAHRTGRSEMARWKAEQAPWMSDVLAALEAPGLTHLRPKPMPGSAAMLETLEGQAAWYRRMLGGPFTPDECIVIKGTSCGLTEIAFDWINERLPVWRGRDLGDPWRDAARWKKSNPPLSGRPLTVGIDWAADRVEWPIYGWDENISAPEIALKPAPRKGKRDLLGTSANVGLNKVKSVRLAKPAFPVILPLVVANHASRPNDRWKRGYGPA